MKFIKSISTSIFTLLLCTACESDLEQVTYSSENAIPSTLSSLNDSYILESKKSTTKGTKTKEENKTKKTNSTRKTTATKTSKKKAEEK